MPSKRSLVDEIKDRCNIVDVIGRSVALKKTGVNHKGLCPFHNEKTPSFIVSEDKQRFTCFGCGATGDVIEFVQRHYNLDFGGAIDKLAAEYGIDTQAYGYAGEGRKSKFFEINREAALFFFTAFQKKTNPGADYMEKRGLSQAVLRRFGIGYADDQWTSLTDHFAARGDDLKLLEKLGLARVSKGRTYDNFRHRVIFPIINTRGKVIGFGGRALEEEQPKYLNSPESLVFQKKDQLYGLNLTRQDINKENCAILVEGYMDAISLYQSGIHNVAASLGTALTERQAAMIRRYTDTVVLAYDADSAGQNAALRGMDILYRAGCRVRVLELDEGQDPDDYVRSHGKEAFLKRVAEAKPFMTYKLDRLRKLNDLTTTEGRVDFLKQAAAALKMISPIEAEAYIVQLAEQTGISEGAIRSEVLGRSVKRDVQTETGASGRRTEQRSRSEEDKRTESEEDCSPVERDLIRLMLAESRFVPAIAEYPTAFSTAAGLHIRDVIQSLYQPDQPIDRQSLADALTEAENRLLQQLDQTLVLAAQADRIFEDCIRHIKETGINRRKAEIIEVLSVLDDEQDGDTIRSLTEELMQIQEQEREMRERNQE
jgi:DNA primase